MNSKTAVYWLLALVALGWAAQEAAAARVFDPSAQRKLKRELQRKKGKGGRTVTKDVGADKFGHAAFDPSFAHEADIEAEDLGLAASEMHAPTPEAINARLRELFPLIDSNHDGAISLHELQHHLYLNALHIAKRRSDREFAESDKNHDGKVTAAEYLTDLEGDSATTIAAVKAFAHPHPLNWEAYTDVELEAMVLSDVDGDKALDHNEFYEYQNAEEGHNEALKLHRLREKIHESLEQVLMLEHEGTHGHADGHADGGEHHDEHDHGARHIDHAVDTGAPHTDWDLRLDWEPFYKTIWQSLSAFELGDGGHRLESEERAAAERRFVVLDTNADELLTPEELLPAFNEIFPPESTYARMEAESLWSEAGIDGDRLTLDMMLAKSTVFYNMVEEHHEEL